MSEQEFQKAAEEAKELSGTPSNEEKLELYKFYKQATVGDVTGGIIKLHFIFRSAWHF